MIKTATKLTRKTPPHEIIQKTGKERLQLWEQARGMWKNRKPDPIGELESIRKEWDRKLT